MPQSCSTQLPLHQSTGIWRSRVHQRHLLLHLIRTLSIREELSTDTTVAAIPPTVSILALPTVANPRLLPQLAPLTLAFRQSTMHRYSKTSLATTRYSTVQPIRLEVCRSSSIQPWRSSMKIFLPATTTTVHRWFCLGQAHQTATTVLQPAAPWQR